ncbi:putative reverse transcriptase protein [Neofusicoccum parvum UCRNP2]|uniref:Putative reverse transcriptase protein n=1 Tax=Botryosphaeria parva (strain UCR-NP2) TaxID=1287680 RepID=R1GA52_BOTPV|nr:putative reverse transcriptase protein [Neofusicoccum parvum UCRNP2]
MSGGAVTSTLRHVTDRKLTKLAEHQQAFELQKAAMLDACGKESNDAEKVRILMNGFKEHAIKYNQGESMVKNIEMFLDQARHDPSVSASLLGEWRAWLEQNLDMHTDKYDYADLFGRLVTEWIENPSDAMKELNAHSGAPQEDLPGARPGSPDSDVDSFDMIGRKEMHEQRKTLEDWIFKEPQIDTSAIKNYLDDLFVPHKKAKLSQKTPLEQLRHGIGEWTGEINVDEDAICHAIQGILRADLFTGPKREQLVDLKSRPEVIKEMVDVLRMDLDSLRSWEWPGPVSVLLRRQLNGKYRAYMDEEVHTAILVHVVGANIAVMLKNAFTAHFHSGAWTQAPYRSMTWLDRRRRHYFLGKANIQTSGGCPSVRDTRRETFMDDWFMTQMPSTIQEGNRDYNDDGTNFDQTKSPLEIKQSLLRMATTEMLVNTKLYGEFTILASDFKWFGPSIPHATMLTVLEYFNLQTHWLDFIKKFLNAPLVFTQDGPDAETRVRRNGIPMGHVLSDALGEAVLFCLDFAVNRKTDGAVLYRFHDDLWFWGQESTCVKAWQTLQEFSEVMGLHLNEEKTAAAKVVSPEKQALAPLHKDLPKGEIRWGFLKLDAKQGRWVIDQQNVDEHILELKRQLAACRSVFAWVQAWNSYVARFFTTNFGQPAWCLGLQHLNLCIETFERIQRSLFAESGAANVAQHLRSVITERFAGANAISCGRPIPDAFFYFPVELGGLGLLNPFIQLCAMRKDSHEDPAEDLEVALLRQGEAYEEAKERFEAGEVPVDQAMPVFSKEPFMDLDEYTRFSEQTSDSLATIYQQLLCPTEEAHVDMPISVEHAMNQLPRDKCNTPGFSNSWYDLKPYWKWIIALYYGETDKRFGGLAICEKGLLPLGLISILRSEKVRWQG